MRALLATLLASAALFAAPTKELSVMDANVYSNMNQDNEAARAYNSNIKEEFKEVIELAPSASFNKNKYYENELIELDLEIKSSSKKEFKIEVALGKNTSMQLLKMNKFSFLDGTYSTKVYLKPLSANAVISSIDVSLFRASSKISEATLQLEAIKIVPLPHDKDFSGVVADNLELNNFKCSPYDEESIICAGDLVAINGALSSFELKGALSASLSANNHLYDRNQSFLALILPINYKKLSFSYFSPELNKFITITKDIVVASEEISTQSDLAPTSKELNYTLQIACLVLAVICVAVVVFFRRFYGLLALAVVLAALGLISGTSFKSATLEIGSAIKILPTSDATVFLRTQNAMKVKVLNDYAEYKKIQLPDDRIGWVHKSYLK